MKKCRLIISAVVLVFFIAEIIMLSLLIKGQNSKNDELMCRVLSSGVGESIDTIISEPIRTSLTMSSDTLLKELLIEEKNYSEAEMTDIMKKYLSGIKECLDADTAFVVSESSRKYYSYEGLNKIIDTDKNEHDVWYSIFINGRKKYDIDVDSDEVNENRWTVFVNCRIEDEKGKLLGVCGVGVTMDEFQDVIRSYESKYNIKVNMVNSDGLVQVDTDSVNIENSYLFDVQYGKEQDGYLYSDDEGNTVSMKFIEDLNWYLVVRKSADSESSVMLQRIIIISMIIMAVCIAVCFTLLTVYYKKYCGQEQ